jgi:23S rRNA (adenine2503-C2)-methyltransferase
MQNLRDLDQNEIAAAVKAAGQPAYRAAQIFKWAQSGVGSFDEMSDIPKALREQLAESFTVTPPVMLRRQIAADGTRKYLWGLADGESVETVLMSYRHGNSVCVSTQVGCRMGCVFCASTKGGFVRNLTPGEILEQIMFAAKDAGVRVSNVVLMGMGEPLLNLQNVIKFLTLVNHEKGLNIGARHISLSTCGLADKIAELAEHDLQITLSISLHAPNDELRSQIMPVNRRYPLRELLSSCDDYTAKTGRRISYEYALIRGFNDTPECARELVRLLRGKLAHVNLIRLNEIEESPLRPSTPEDTEKFMEMLNRSGVTATLRRRLGFDIDASCGQLRRKYGREDVYQCRFSDSATWVCPANITRIPAFTSLGTRDSAPFLWFATAWAARRPAMSPATLRPVCLSRSLKSRSAPA